jgi:hypothetical protein
MVYVGYIYIEWIERERSNASITYLVVEHVPKPSDKQSNILQLERDNCIPEQDDNRRQQLEFLYFFRRLRNMTIDNVR